MGRLALWEVRIVTRAGAQTCLLSSSAGRSALRSASWSLGRIGGCLDFEMEVLADLLPGTIALSSLVEVRIQPVGGTKTLYYTGAITETPSAGTTAKVVRYRGVGLWEQWVNRLATSYYAGATTSAIATSILSDYSGETDISPVGTEISIASPYTVGDLELEYVTVADAVKLLAEVQKSVDYGIDQNRKFYFRDSDTGINEHLHVGKHIVSFEPSKRRDRLVNHVLLQNKKGVGGGLLIQSREDATSITTNGRRTKLVKLPDLSNPTDAWRYGDYLLGVSKNETTEVAVKPRTFEHFRFPKGKTRIYRGTTTYDLPIEKVNYTLGENSLEGELELGDRPVTELVAEVKELVRKIDVEQTSMISTTRIVHSRGEEFQQAALSDARKQGNYNVFADGFTDDKLLDPTLSKNLEYREQHLTCNQDFNKATAISIPIETGQQVSTIRVHVDTDPYGRLEFTTQSDLDDFWTQTSPGAWFIEQDVQRITNALNPGQRLVRRSLSSQGLYFPDTGFELRGQVLRNLSNERMFLVWNWVDTLNYCHLSFKHDTASGYTKGYLGKVVGGAQTEVTANFTNSGVVSAFTVKAVARKDPTESIGLLTDVSDPSNKCLLTMAIPLVSGRQVLLATGPLPEAGAYSWEWFEIRELGYVKVYVSRDDGTTWTEASIASTGIYHTNVNVSAQPSGSKVRLKTEIAHPGRLYGWGISFKNA